MPARKPPERYWRSYGNDPIPTGAEALDEPFAAFPSWLIRITCDRCGKDRMFAETHFAQRDMQLRQIIKRMRHDGCGGRAGKVELMTGIEGVVSRPVRKIVLRAEWGGGRGSMSGVFLKRGMTVAKPELRMSIGEDGKPKASLAFQIHYDVCPVWLDLAARHLVEAEERKLARIAAWQYDDADARSATLEREFESSRRHADEISYNTAPLVPYGPTLLAFCVELHHRLNPIKS